MNAFSSLRQILPIGLLLLALSAPTCAEVAPDYADQVRHRPIFQTSITYVGTTPPPTAESQELLTRFEDFNQGVKPGIDSLEQFLSAHPKSAWKPSLETHLAEHYRNHGYFTRALTHWASAWAITKDTTDSEGHAVAGEAFAHWTRLLASLGRLEELQTLFAEARTRGLDNGRLQPLIEGTQGGAATMVRRPGVSYRCGTIALFQVGRQLAPENAELNALPQIESPESGFNMAQLLGFALSNHLDMVAVQRLAGTEIVTPSVVHWRQNHYAAILERKGNRYKVADPTFGDVRWFEADAINEEASGHFLVPAGQLPANWQPMALADAGQISGKGAPDDIVDDEDADDSCDDDPDSDGGSGDGADTAATEPPAANDDCASCPDPSDPPESSEDASSDKQGCGCESGDCPDDNCDVGMPIWRVSQPYITQWFRDTPIYYRDSRGKMVKFRVTFKHRSTDVNTAAAGLGNNWACNLISDIQTDTTLTTVKQFIPGGGSRAMAADGSTHEFKRGTVTTTGTGGGNAPFKIDFRSGGTTKYGYKQPFASGITNYFMTNKTDRLGRVTALNWAAVTVGAATVHRLTNTLDPDGKGFTMAYTNATYPNLITSVSDPYGRSANFIYDSSGRLTNIVDMVGLSTTFVYGSGNLISSMTTPYGTTSFTYENSSYYNPSQPHSLGHAGVTTYDRALTVTEPGGGKQLFAYADIGPERYRSSYHWNARQYATIAAGHMTNYANLDATDYSHASLKVFLHKYGGTPWVNPFLLSSTAAYSLGPDMTASGPDSRIVRKLFGYPGQFSSIYEGTSGMASTIQKYTDGVANSGGFAHINYLTRNDYGRVTDRVREYGTVADYVIRNITNRYDFDQGGRRLTKKWGPNGELLRSYVYHATYPYLITSVTNALNQVTKYTYDTTLKKVTSITYPSGMVVSNILYSSGTNQGWLQTQIVIGVSTNSYSYVNGKTEVQTNELGLVTTNTWDNLNRLTSVKYPDSTTVSNIYSKLNVSAVKNRLGNWTYFGYDSMGHCTSVTNANNAVTQFVYCTCGSLDQIIEPLGQNTYFYYDIAGRKTNVVYPDGHSVTNEYFDDGHLSQVTDNGGHVLNYAYDTLGHVVSITVPGGGTRMQYAYDEFGRVTNSVDANSVATGTSYDLLGRVTMRTVTSGASTPTISSEKFMYNLNGLATNIDSLGKTNYFVHDSRGRLLSQTNANLEHLAFTYNPAGQLLSLADGKNQITRWAYDQYGRISAKTNDSGQAIITYSYDVAGRMTNRWTAAKTNTVYYYDAVGNLTNVMHAVSPSVALIYDLNNRLTTMIDGFGTTRFTYTPAGQLASEDGPWVDDTISYAYTNRLTSSMALLQPNASTWLQYNTYDIAQRLESLTAPAGSFSYDYSSGISTVPATLTFPNGASVHYGYDDIARLTSTELQASDGTVLNRHEYLYNLGHQRTNEMRSDAYALASTVPRVDYTYDQTGQLLSALASDDNGSTLTTRPHESFGYTYDAAGNLSVRTNNPGANQLLQTFTLDNLNQLTSANRSGLMTVSGLSSGGATSVTVNANAGALYVDGSFAKQGLILTNGSNKYTAIALDGSGRKDTNTIIVSLPTISSYTYDQNGNMLSDMRRGFTYDDENQLTSVTVTNVTKSEFAYDGRRRRRITRDYTWSSSSWNLSKETHYIYDGMVVIQERDQNNVPLVSYTRGMDISHRHQGAGGIGGLLARTDNGSKSSAYYHSDSGGNVTMLINWQSKIIASYRYDPYGNITALSGPLAIANSLRYSSKEWHNTAGLYYYGFRFYEPNLQRWINQDPSQERGGFNLVQFAQNRPVTGVDRYGLDFGAMFPGLDQSGLYTPPAQGQDSAGAKCCTCKMTPIELRTASGDFPINHTYIAVGDTGYGHYPAAGMGGIVFGGDGSGTTASDDIGHDYDPNYTQKFTACPETVAALMASINNHMNDPYELFNINGRNCAGWATDRLDDAHIPYNGTGIFPTAPIFMPSKPPGCVFGEDTSP